jgi:CheY-like chemotaxis protein
MTMPKILLVDPDRNNRAVLSKRLAEAGYQTATADTGSSAVSALEWERPDLVVSSAKVQDMDGYELFGLVRKDATTMDTPFLLLAGGDRPLALAAAEAGVTLVLTGDLSPERVVERVGSLLTPGGRDDARTQPGSFGDGATARTSKEPLWAALGGLGTGARPSTGYAAPEFQGSLEVMDLAEVTQAIALGGKTGSLAIGLSAGDGTIVFQNGRLIHASFGQLTGENAFAAIVLASQHEQDARFSFARMERAEVSRGPRTISRSVDQLLLSIAVGIDEGDIGGNRLEDVSVRRGDG